MKKKVLIISQFYEPNVNWIISKMDSKRIPWVRFNTETYPMLIKSGCYYGNDEIQRSWIEIDKKKYTSENIKSVWYRRSADPVTPINLNIKEKNFIIQESKTYLRSFLDTLTDPLWINNREKEMLASNKFYQLDLAKQVGFRIPETIVTNDENAVKDFYFKHNRSVIFKPLSGVSYSSPNNSKEIYNAYKDEFLIEPEIENREKENATVPVIFAQLLDDEKIKSISNVRYCPTVFQEYINKDIELRITVVGTEIFACAINSQKFEETKVDFRKFIKFKNCDLEHTVFKLPSNIESKLLKMMKQLGLIFGCFDIILTKDGEFVFLEVNPNGQWMWIENRTGLKISDALISALVN